MTHYDRINAQLAARGQPNLAESLADRLDATPENQALVPRLIVTEQAARTGDVDAIGRLTELHGERLEIAEQIAFDLGYTHGLLDAESDEGVAPLASAMLSMPAASDRQRVRALVAALRVAVTSLGP